LELLAPVRMPAERSQAARRKRPSAFGRTVLWNAGCVDGRGETLLSLRSSALAFSCGLEDAPFSSSNVPERQPERRDGKVAGIDSKPEFDSQNDLGYLSVHVANDENH